MELKNLIRVLEFDQNRFAADLLNQTVTGVTSDSRKVRPGFVFVAVRGVQSDGHEHIDSALKNGAILIIGETPQTLQVSDSRKALALLTCEFYENPSQSMLMIGVTGTSGKTTTTYILESILKEAGHRVGVIGTINIRYEGVSIPSELTTPSSEDLNRILAEMKSKGCTAVVMEVSSHALKQKRTYGFCFDGMVFTGLSAEHLDFHSDMEDYFLTKKLLFTEYAELSRRCGKSPIFSINESNSYGARLAQEVSGKHVFKFGTQKLGLSAIGTKGRVSGVDVQSRLVGRFNAENILGALILCLGLKIPKQNIEQGIKKLHSVPGRLEAVEGNAEQDIQVFVDYAHKPDALEKVLDVLNEIKTGKIITVFGCGGDRDRTKRPVMGKIAVQKSDWVIVTSDNPRTEDPNHIIKEIMQGVLEYENVIVESDRKKAILTAITKADKNDTVLIAGKGHENYQIVGTVKSHFDDVEEAQKALQRRCS